MTFLIKNLLFLLFMLLIDLRNKSAEHYERTKFDLYKDDICLDLTLTYVLMDNFLSLFLIMRQAKTKIFLNSMRIKFLLVHRSFILRIENLIKKNIFPAKSASVILLLPKVILREVRLLSSRANELEAQNSTRNT